MQQPLKLAICSYVESVFTSRQAFSVGYLVIHLYCSLELHQRRMIYYSRLRQEEENEKQGSPDKQLEQRFPLESKVGSILPTRTGSKISRT